MHERLRTVATYPNASEAHFFAERLRDAGLFVAVADEHVVTTDYFLGAAVAGIKVQVREQDVEQAEAILAVPEPPFEGEIPWDQQEPGEDTDRDADQPDTPDVPATEAEVLVDRAFRSAILGIFFFFLPVLTVGSLNLLFRVRSRQGELPARARGRFIASFAIDGVALALAVLFWTRLGRG